MDFRVWTVLVSCEAFDGDGLESITTGSNVFTGGGKRIDALLRTRGYVRSLVFAEIKKHTEDLLSRLRIGNQMFSRPRANSSGRWHRSRRQQTRRSVDCGSDP